MDEKMQQEHAELKSQVRALTKEMVQVQQTIEEQRLLLLGNGKSDGLLHRTQRLERDCAELSETVAKQLNSVIIDLRKVTSTLLGELNGDTKKAGLISVVSTHDKMLADGRKIIWLIVTIGLGLLATSLWNIISTPN
jgi:hypothetical protein